MKTYNENGIGGLQYVAIKNIPLSLTSTGREVVSSETVRLCEELVARTILTGGLPIRGAEVKFLRKCLGESLDTFGGPLGLTGAAIKKWEEEPAKRLSISNEVAVRSLIAERLGVSISGKFSNLYGRFSEPIKLDLDFSLCYQQLDGARNLSQIAAEQLVGELRVKLIQLESCLGGSGKAELIETRSESSTETKAPIELNPGVLHSNSAETSSVIDFAAYKSKLAGEAR